MKDLVFHSSFSYLLATMQSRSKKSTCKQYVKRSSYHYFALSPDFAEVYQAHLQKCEIQFFLHQLAVAAQIHLKVTVLDVSYC